MYSGPCFTMIYKMVILNYLMKQDPPPTFGSGKTKKQSFETPHTYISYLLFHKLIFMLSYLLLHKLIFMQIPIILCVCDLLLSIIKLKAAKPEIKRKKMLKKNLVFFLFSSVVNFSMFDLLPQI